MWVLDTNIISETRKPNPNGRVIDWIEKQPAGQLYVTAVSLAEIRFGITTAASPDMAANLTVWLDTTVRPWFNSHVLDATEDALLEWRTMAKILQASKKPAPPADLLIAAIASINGMGIASRDVAPFVAAGIRTLNPFTSERFNGA